jgi:hypothetical protein
VVATTIEGRLQSSSADPAIVSIPLSSATIELFSLSFSRKMPLV